MHNNRWIRLLIWVILYIVFFEAFLCLGGRIVVFNQDWQNKRHLKEKNVYKIMCLGDSMTEFGDEDSYPNQLDRILKGTLNHNFEGLKAETKVINKGISGATSDIITKNIESYLAEYTPDMVVVMMGATDRKDFLSKDKPGLLSGFDNALNNVKTYRLFKEVGAQILQKFCALAERCNAFQKKQLPAAEIERPVPQNDAFLLIYAINLRANKNYDKAEMILRYLLSLDLEKGFNERVHSELAEMYHDQKRYRDMIPLIYYYLSDNESAESATEWVAEICSSKTQEAPIIPMLTSLVEQKPESIALNNRLGECYQAYGYPDRAQVYFDKVDALSERWDNTELTHNYLRLYEILKERGVKSVFVQYPTKNVRLLKKMFRTVDADDIIFVPNEEDFKGSHDLYKYSEYFKDRFFIDFGHCTSYGNHILANQVAIAISTYLNKILK